MCIDAEKRNDNKCIKLGGGTIYSAKRWKEYPLYPDDLKAVANERKTNVFVLTDTIGQAAWQGGSYLY